MDLTPLIFLQLLRDCHPDMARAGLFGKCFRVYRLLKAVWPEAIAYSDINHVITEIDGKFYDICGQIGEWPNYTKMSQEAMDRALTWDVRAEAEELHFAKYKDKIVK